MSDNKKETPLHYHLAFPFDLMEMSQSLELLFLGMVSVIGVFIKPG
jgi:hypothetical protein